MLTLADSRQTSPRRSVNRNEDASAWALVLAAGEGSRLKALTMMPSGVHVPKQFCSLLSGPSLVHEALQRAQSVAPRERVCTIVAAQHRRWWETLPEQLPVSNVIVQPENRGTANGILLALTHIAARDRHAPIVLLPADHHVLNEPILAASLRCAVDHLRAQPDELLLLGMTPDQPDPELGYILPGARATLGTFVVSQFVEKPLAAQARALIGKGALWNAFIVAATVQSLLNLLRRQFPGIVAAMRDVVSRDLHRPRNPLATAGLYERLPSLDFSRDVLSNGKEAKMRVLPVPRCGWSDLGTSTRLGEILRQLRNCGRAHETLPGMSTQISLAARFDGLPRVETARSLPASANAG